MQENYIIFMLPIFGSAVALLIIPLQNRHLLMVLLALELVMLNLFLLSLLTSWQSFNTHMCLILIALAACEASLGLAVLVSLISTHGNDYVQSFTTHKC